MQTSSLLSAVLLAILLSISLMSRSISSSWVKVYSAYALSSVARTCVRRSRFWSRVVLNSSSLLVMLANLSLMGFEHWFNWGMS
jgi:hypothetical protein